MVELEEYLKLDNSYKAIYLRNNINYVNQLDKSLENLFYNISSDVDIILNCLSISASKAGYRYWKDAVFIYIVNCHLPVSICNDIYPAIAMKYKKTGVAVERAMRVCFEDVMYHSSKNGRNYVVEYLSNYLLFPHNSELLLRIVELVVSRGFQEEKIKLTKLK